MFNKKLAFSFLVVFILAPFYAHSTDGVKVVPIGQSIKPEAAPKKKVRRRRPRATIVKAGTSFLVTLTTALSSGITKQGDTVNFVAAEDVGPGRRAAIKLGAPGEGTVTFVDPNKKQGKIKVQLESIESIRGKPIAISGEIEITGNKSHAVAAYGERFTATLDERAVARPVRRARRNRNKEAPLVGFAEISGKGVKIDLKKGQARGKVKLILEAPKGHTADDIDVSSVELAYVNGTEVANPPIANKGKPKQGDANKNGVTDWTLYFDAWDFVKNQPEGRNLVKIEGNLKSGAPFVAESRVQVDY